MVRSKIEIDLTTDPPPDLVIGVDIGRSSIDKLAMFAAVGVPEIWRHDGTSLSIYLLQEGAYVASSRSLVLRPIGRSDLEGFVATRPSMRWPEWAQLVRESVRS